MQSTETSWALEKSSVQVNTYFLEFSLDSLCKFNATFQLDLPKLPALKTEVKRLLCVLLGHFVTAQCIKQLDDNTENINLSTLSNRDCQLPDADLAIGRRAKAFIDDPINLITASMKTTLNDRVKQVIRVQKLVGLPLPALELLGCLS